MGSHTWTLCIKWENRVKQDISADTLFLRLGDFTIPSIWNQPATSNPHMPDPLSKRKGGLQSITTHRFVCGQWVEWNSPQRVFSCCLIYFLIMFSNLLMKLFIYEYFERAATHLHSHSEWNFLIKPCFCHNCVKQEGAFLSIRISLSKC